MKGTGGEERGGARAVALFAEFLERADRGGPASLDELCALHPEHAGELRRLGANWQRVASLVANVPAGYAEPPPGGVAGRLRASLGDGVDPAVELRGSEVPSAVFERLASRGDGAWRYEGGEELGRGGMGVVLRVRDADLRRALAMKVLAGSEGLAQGGAAVDPRRVRRFLEEAQVTGQLDHPGVVPVHELGLDGQGRLFFTMRLVRGRELGAVFDLARDGREGWSRTRVLTVLLRVCETMAFAHSKGVIHRDLKPSNVMVGRFGETYVMDWGLAKVVGGPESDEVGAGERVSTSGTDSDPALLTLEGTAVGTPAYMPPEQARGDAAAMGPRADVYSTGAMLYHLLAGHPPFLGERGSAPTARAVLARVLEGPPAPLARAAPDAQPELVAVCEKAMQRDPELRYADMGEMAEDLRAYLEVRVVRAHATGAAAELRKWIARNRGTALASAAAALVALVGLASTSLVQARSNRALAERNADLALARDAARDQELLAVERAAEAEAERVKVLRLSDLTRLEGLRERADGLYPTLPSLVPALEAWTGEARDLVGRLPAHEADLAALRERALPPEEVRSRSASPVAARLAAARATLAELEAILARKREGELTQSSPETTLASIEVVRGDVEALEVEHGAWSPWTFATQELQWQHDQLERLVAGVREFAGEDGTLADVERRLAFARTVGERTVSGPDVRELWARALDELADPAGLYGGLAVEPRVGLVPLGADPRSGLQEFALLETGRPPARGSDGSLLVDGDTALVLVLLPGGSFTLGAINGPPGPDSDPWAIGNTVPLRELALAPFFASKYEMTQGQWLRATGENPSVLHPDQEGDFHERYTLANPVENVTWREATAELARLGLRLPTEAQWEYAARAGTRSVWWMGNDPRALDGVANVYDRSADWNGVASSEVETWLEDGFVGHAPVGSYASNPFGLHDVYGNVWELCLEMPGSYELDFVGDDAERLGGNPSFRMLRGGSFNERADNCRSAMRFTIDPDRPSLDVGLRPVRPL